MSKSCQKQKISLKLDTSPIHVLYDVFRCPLHIGHGTHRLWGVSKPPSF